MKINEATEKEYREAHGEVIRLWMEFENAKQRLELAEKACLEAQGQKIIEICFGETWTCPDCKKEVSKSEMIFSGLDGACVDCWKKRNECEDVIE